MHCHHPGCIHPSTVDQDTAHKTRLLWIALALISGFSLVELGVSWSSHSLALLAEAGHMLSDSLALGVALLASWMARLPASDRATFGYRRVESLAALANSLSLLAIACWIGWEAMTRLQASPTEIVSLPMLMTAAVGLGVNSLNAFLLHDYSHHDLNLRGAFLHMVADATSSVGVLLAAIAIWAFHWNWADGAVSLLVAGIIAVSTLPLLGQSLSVLMEQTPEHVDLDQVRDHLGSFAGVVSVDQLRVWAIALNQTILSAHLIVEVRDTTQRDRLLSQMQASLQQQFGIQEVFLQMTAPLLAQPISLSQPPTLEWLSITTSLDQP